MGKTGAALTHYRGLVLLDRDGVLNEDDDNFVRTADALRIFDAAVPSVRRLNEAGLCVCVITNQSGIAKGYFSLADLTAMHEKLNQTMVQGGAKLDAIYFCPHNNDENCRCRKPEIGMPLRGQEMSGIPLSQAFVVGDRPADIQCARNAGATGILALSGKTSAYEPEVFKPQPDAVVSGISEAVDYILKTLQLRADTGKGAES
jgi:histidinol-phosphate phosphatase family protein